MTRIKLAPVKPKVDEKSKVESLKVVSRKTSEAQLRAVKKYDEKHIRINCRISPEIKTQLDEHCNASGESLTGFIVRACLEQIKRDQMQN